eukprot:Sspe_Gene.1276::Locus_429_Transcript_6_7_Confidence_0.250_Length_787::g.1276::m.1276
MRDRVIGGRLVRREAKGSDLSSSTPPNIRVSSVTVPTMDGDLPLTVLHVEGDPRQSQSAAVGAVHKHAVRREENRKARSERRGEERKTGSERDAPVPTMTAIFP